MPCREGKMESGKLGGRGMVEWAGNGLVTERIMMGRQLFEEVAIDDWRKKKISPHIFMSKRRALKCRHSNVYQPFPRVLQYETCRRPSHDL